MKRQELQKLIQEEIQKVLKEAEAPIYTDWEENVNPDYIVVHLKDGRKLQISKKHIAGGQRVYQAILQAFSDQRTEITNKIVGAMASMMGGSLKEGQELTEGNIMIFSYAKPYKKPDASKIRAEADKYIKFLQSKNFNVHTGSDALYFPNFVWAGGKQQLGECIGVLAGSETIVVSPIGENKTYRFGESLLARFVKDDRIPAFLIKGSTTESVQTLKEDKKETEIIQALKDAFEEKGAGILYSPFPATLSFLKNISVNPKDVKIKRAVSPKPKSQEYWDVLYQNKNIGQLKFKIMFGNTLHLIDSVQTLKKEGLDSKPIKSFKVTDLAKIFAKIGFPTTKVEVYDNVNAGPTLSIVFKNTLADENAFIDAYTDFQFDNGALGSWLPDIESAYHKGGNKWEFQMQK